ncbi:MAG: NAD(P)H-binding protein [Acidobacteriota bacterium]
MNILVTGGTGGLGRMLVRALCAARHDVRVISRRPRPESTPVGVEWAEIDLAAGEGVAEALEGVDTIIHSASDPKNADAVDVTGTRHLVEAANSRKVAHLVYISIVGIDAIDYGYYQKKLAAERIIEAGEVQFSILRATQFHSLVNSMISAAARLPLIMPLPTNFKFQSVAEFEVVEQLVGAVQAGPRGRLPDFGGPEVLTLGEMATTWMEIRQIRKWLIGMPLPGTVAAAFRAGRNTAPEGVRARMTWREWLTKRGEKKAE